VNTTDPATAQPASQPDTTLAHEIAELANFCALQRKLTAAIVRQATRVVAASNGQDLAQQPARQDEATP
jgi:hypothetical protein